MPKTNRNNDINYTIILINNKKDKIRMLDLTTSSNFRNYKWTVENAIKNGTKKTNKIVNEVRKYGQNNFTYEKLDFYYGKYTEAVKKLQSVSNKLGIDSNHSVSKEVIELRDKLITESCNGSNGSDGSDGSNCSNCCEATSELIENQTELLNDKPQLITDETGKVKCNYCGKFMLKSNLKRHIKNKHE